MPRGPRATGTSSRCHLATAVAWATQWHPPRQCTDFVIKGLHGSKVHPSHLQHHVCISGVQRESRTGRGVCEVWLVGECVALGETMAAIGR